MSSISDINQIIQRNQKRQGMRYSVAFGLGTICGLFVASFFFIVNQNKQLSSEIHSLKTQMRPVSYPDDLTKNNDLTIPPPYSF